MKKKQCYLNYKSIIIIFILLFSSADSSAQLITSDSARSGSINFSLGGVYYNFRDEISSQQIYSGPAGAHIGFGYTKRGTNNLQHHFDLFFEYGNAKYKEVQNNDFTNIYRLYGGYSICYEKTKQNSNLTWLIGAAVKSDALYIVYPFLFGNNGDAYSIDLLAFGPWLGTSRKIKNGRIDISFKFDLLEWNIRPQSFNGVSPNVFFSESQITSLHNNNRLSFKTAYSFPMLNNRRIEFSYLWHYRRNRSTIRLLDYAQHNLNIKFYFNNLTK